MIAVGTVYVSESRRGINGSVGSLTEEKSRLSGFTTGCFVD